MVRRLLPLLFTLACGDASAPTDASFDGAAVPTDAAPDADTPDAGQRDGGTDADAGEVLDARIEDAGVDAGGPLRGSEGCGAAAALEAGEHHFELEGRDRRFGVHLPSEYDPTRAYPLVLALHGNGGSLEYWNGTSGPRNLRGALADDAVLVLAEAIEGNWRDYGDQPGWGARIESELLYFDTVIERTESSLCIDRGAIFSIGFSGGGSFAGVLGCRRTDIRGIAAGGAVIYFDADECVGTPAAWVAFSEGDSNDGRQAFLGYWRALGGCGFETEASSPEGCVSSLGCAADHPVEFCSYPGGHVWPDFGVDAAWTFLSSLAPGAP